VTSCEQAEYVLDETAADCLVVSNDPSELARVAAWVNAWAQHHGVPPRLAERLDLCSTEVVTNIMMHGSGDGGSYQISLRLDRQDQRLALEIQDRGLAFDPRCVDEPPAPARLSEAAIGGRGLQLVRRFSDEWHYFRAEGRNCSTLVFHLSADRQSGHDTRHVR
jgi:serine/threonine-protein kinase RsbW